ncbi:hypothetical protein BAG01nite_47500 [Brevibacillus agri]|uniref:Uncharacterized protein n=1 Tax=Brevibacillus agri TaxID=51101 RepID=A0A3M8AMW0_9BACL|nr:MULTISPECIES: DUF6075 family protein [Brevibacillus]MED3501186.1 DUF6075 family protein [Brevibacillus agri]QAV15764.1 hypothetical protein BA6348_25215 [Brevibacillus agri]QHZ58455.1 hypothetical protein M655_023995 [Brevibacillus sp. NSP2.1]RNB51977.1 hypothetical protein EB820_19425 [Brevibacillus agri]GED28648.1 hypothetical protein BAG01nite_47500 [Brevibacillus agri]
MIFLFPEHQERYEQFIRQDGTHPKDRERQALLYVFAGFRDLGDRIEHFYDFEGRMIRSEAFEEVNLTSSSRAMVELAFNLYNNYPCGTVVDLFANLDERNRQLAIKAIKIRFGVNESGDGII